MEYFRKGTSKNRYLEEKILQQEQKEGDTSICKKIYSKICVVWNKRKNIFNNEKRRKLNEPIKT